MELRARGNFGACVGGSDECVQKDIDMKGLIRRRIDTDALWGRDAAEVCVALRRGVFEVASERGRLIGSVRILLGLSIAWHGHHICWEVPAMEEESRQK